ncbi:unannotated protein [freshwater metagenome]|uniref:Unannotated protein n=1 Tax=freshwater metagenome TaxID=449393 RepID=A0A6J7A1C0_9ZZZZ
MVLEAVPDTGGIHPAAQQENRGMDGTRAQDHLAGLELCAVHEANPDGRAPTEQNVVHLGTPPDVQVRALPGGFEVAVVRGDPPAQRATGQRHRRRLLGQRREQGAAHGAHLARSRRVEHERRAGEPRGERCPVPASCAESCPAVVVIRDTGDRDHGVHCGRTAHSAPSLVLHTFLPGCPTGQQTRPATARFLECRKEVRSRNPRRSVLHSVVRTGFQKQYLRLRVLAESRREHRAGRTGTDDDEVVHHFARPGVRRCPRGGQRRCTARAPTSSG